MDSVDPKARRRTQIMECARQVFAEKGYSGATVDDIVARVEVARGTFYLYFKDKRDVYDALVDRFLQSIDDALIRIDVNSAEPPIEQLRANLLRATRLAHDDAEMMRLVLLGAAGVDPEIAQKLQAFWRAVLALIETSLKDGQAMGMVRTGDRQVMAAMGLGAIKEILLESVVRGDMDRSAEQLTDEILRFLANGVLNQQDL